MLYLRDNACYTKSEMKFAIKMSNGRIKIGDFKPIETLEELKLCSTEESHPYCSENYYNVNNYIYQLVEERNFKGDGQYLLSKETHDIFLDVSDPDMGWKPIDTAKRTALIETIKQVGNVTVFLKCLGIRHVYLLVIKIKDDKVVRVDFVDTSPIILDSQLLLKRVKYILKTDISDAVEFSIPLNEYANAHSIEFASDVVNLQVMERIVSRFGYCNAWVLYFIFSYVEVRVPFVKMFEKLLKGNNPTGTIIEWWRNIFNLSRSL